MGRQTPLPTTVTCRAQCCGSTDQLQALAAGSSRSWAKAPLQSYPQSHSDCAPPQATAPLPHLQRGDDERDQAAEGALGGVVKPAQLPQRVPPPHRRRRHAAIVQRCSSLCCALAAGSCLPGSSCGCRGRRRQLPIAATAFCATRLHGRGHCLPGAQVRAKQLVLACHQHTPHISCPLVLCMPQLLQLLRAQRGAQHVLQGPTLATAARVGTQLFPGLTAFCKLPSQAGRWVWELLH